MLHRIQEYIVDHEGIPTDDELSEAIKAKKLMPKTMHILKWWMNYSGGYCIEILESDNTPDDVRERMPKVYGL